MQAALSWLTYRRWDLLGQSSSSPGNSQCAQGERMLRPAAGRCRTLSRAQAGQQRLLSGESGKSGEEVPQAAKRRGKRRKRWAQQSDKEGRSD